MDSQLKKLCIGVGFLCLVGCHGGSSGPEDAQSAAALRKTAEEMGTDWMLGGSVDERFLRVAGQLRGWDATMVEVGYRYSMLYWAGTDENWEFARYQLAKIGDAVELGLERRAEYKDKARMLDAVVPRLEEALQHKDPEQFRQRFTELTSVCNACHQATEHAWVRIKPPSVRFSPASQPPDDAVVGSH